MNEEEIRNKLKSIENKYNQYVIDNCPNAKLSCINKNCIDCPMNTYNIENCRELWNKCKELEDKYYSICDGCGPGNGCDDCRDCDKGDEKSKIYRELSSIKKEIKEKYNLDYDSFKELTKELKKDDIYSDWQESQKNNLKLYTQEDLEKKEEEIESWKNKYFYLQADLENIRKRYNKQIEDLKKYEGENILNDLLEIFDNLDYSVNDDIDILNTYNALLKLFMKYEIELIYEEERPIFFNSEYDEAIASVTTTDPSLDNSIHKVYKKGFLYKDKILRYEKVIVNKFEK